MTEPATHTVFLLRSVSHAMKGEAALTRAGIPNKVIPVPRTLSSQCGVCLRVDLEDRERAEQALRAAGLEITGTHDIRTTRRQEATSE